MTSTSANANASSIAGGKVQKRKYRMNNRKAAATNVAGPVESNTMTMDGHMTAEEVERHLQSRQTLMELLPERAPATVPTEMFSNEPSLDG